MRISDLIGNPSAIIDLIEKYEAELDLSEAEISLRGKTLEDANKEQGTLMYRYARLYAEARNVGKFLDSRADKIRSTLYKEIKRGSDATLADRIIDKFVDGEQDMLDHVALMIELKTLEEKLGAVVEAVKMRGYALNNITKARIESIHLAVL